MRIKLNVALKGYRKGQIISIKSENGKPLELYWRKRLRDSKKDNCITVIGDKK